MTLAQRILLQGATDEACSSHSATRRGEYLTDGHSLYYSLGAISDAPGLAGVEDCGTLEVMLLPVEQVAQLRAVRATTRG